MRYTGPKEKLSRRVGENLGLKAERSFSPKSSFLKKPYWPGMHGKSRRRPLSEFGTQETAPKMQGKLMWVNLGPKKGLKKNEEKKSEN